MSDNTETAILAGGCFWIMQQLLREPDGVLSTRTGWTGGESVPTPHRGLPSSSADVHDAAIWRR